MANGGIIGKVNNPTSTTATGVWQQEEQYEAKVTDTWPERALFTTKSCRFNPGSSDTLSKTLSTPTNNKKFTFSFWFKKCENGREQHVVNGGAASSQFYFNSSDQLYFYDQTAGGTYKTTQVFRDVSAWYHIVVAEDTTQGTASSRIRIYVNGSEITDFAIETDPTQNNASAYNTAATYTIGTYAVSPSGYYLNGYLAEFVFIDGQQLTPTSFGVANSDGVWTPIPYTGTFGNNGFNLQFQNSAALGTDSSPNGNTFTVNNLTSIDQSTDYPVVNYSTFNPLIPSTSGLSEGNLKVTIGSVAWMNGFSTIAVTSGKWYFEAKNEGGGNFMVIGICEPSQATYNLNLGYTTRGYGYNSNGKKYNSDSASTYGNTYGQNDIVSCAVDFDNNKIYFAKNGTYQNSGDPTSGATGTGSAFNLTDGYDYYLGCSFNNNNGSVNFGSPPYAISSSNADGNGYGNFEYAPPSGYYALNTANLAEFG